MGEEEEVKLLGTWYSPVVLRAKIALRLKSVDYDYVEEDLFGSKSELLLKSNPVYKKVPVLIHNSKPVCESLNIVEYIDETWNSSGPAILPSHPHDRALARFWSAFVDDKWFPALMAAVVTKSEDAKAKGMEEVEEGLLQLEDAFNALSKGKSFFGGETIGLMDICLGSFLVFLKAREKLKKEKILTELKTPTLYRWANRFLSDEMVKIVVPEIDKVAKFIGEFEDSAQSVASKS
ncbi:Glutathione S-transferase C-terminal [Arabidopsis thaliana x Arabidopsis arenosa]|uniref:glutathione transferase n=1 Tax=Arabidopsis thaliana x Arabidopsis arenosa TaxID=1240361 RepID=A0A8T2BD48_9BRAS|nr:Glutathione S-transferase C-terminal [Arabidopsis thaliana x Arabidopsis arenosa]